MRLIGLVKSSVIMLWLALMPGMIMAEIYRWVDDSGRMHFGDRPPATGAEQIKLPETTPSPAPDAVDAELRTRVLKMLESERQRRTAQAAEEERQLKARRDACEKTRNRLMRFRSVPHIYERQPDGQKRYLSDEERAVEESRMQAQLAKFCGEGALAAEEPAGQR